MLVCGIGYSAQDNHVVHDCAAGIVHSLRPGERVGPRCPEGPCCVELMASLSRFMSLAIDAPSASCAFLSAVNRLHHGNIGFLGQQPALL